MTISVVRLLFAALTAGASLASPLEKRQGSCSSPKQRRAWHTLSDDEKRAYIDAERCLMSRDATLDLYGARTKFDELQSCHVLQAASTHQVGGFLPFHRLLLHAHEQLLESECGYTGGQPYWQEQLDSGNFANSVVLDPRTGFGGNGGDGECIGDGPFAEYRNQIGYGYARRDQCIRRNINETASSYTSQDRVDDCLATGDYLNAWTCIEGWPHYGGHAGVGGQMANPISSPGDPIFYLHHAWLDKIWWDWQARDLPRRLTEMAGENRQLGNWEGQEPCGGEEMFGPRPPEIPMPEVRGDDGGCATTLNHQLDMKGLIPNRVVGDVMDIQGGVLCYQYVEP